MKIFHAMTALAAVATFGSAALPAMAQDYRGYDAGYADPCQDTVRGAGVAGGLLGAIAGAVVGSNLAHGGGRTGGAIIGALGGAAIGNNIGRSSAKNGEACQNADGRYAQVDYYGQGGYAQPIYQRPTYIQPGYVRPVYAAPAYDGRGYGQTRYLGWARGGYGESYGARDSDRHDHYGYDRDGERHHQDGYDQGYDRQGGGDAYWAR